MPQQILFLIPAGPNTLDELRARRLMRGNPGDVTFHISDRKVSRRQATTEAAAAIASKKWDFICMEGSGSLGGVPLISAARRNKIKYLVSFGDPISNFFRTTRGPVHGAVFEVYERLLYRYSTGIVGWTPYITGRAIAKGAPRAATVEGGVDLGMFELPTESQRLAARRALQIPDSHLVCGMVGSMRWSDRQQYCYGLELVKMFPYLGRTDVTLLMVGDGDGRERLEQLVPAAVKDRVIFTGRIPADEVPTKMQAMDIGFVTQTLDGLGSYRLTTKLPEYLASGVAVAMSPVPGYFDYVGRAGWALPPFHPASDAFHRGVARWLDSVSKVDVMEKREYGRSAAERFDDQVLIARFQDFLEYCYNVS
jgi:hypothetical protein